MYLYCVLTKSLGYGDDLFGLHYACLKKMEGGQNCFCGGAMRKKSWLRELLLSLLIYLLFASVLGLNCSFSQPNNTMTT